MVYYIAKAVEERRQANGGRWVTGDQLIQSDGGFDFQGFNQVSRVNSYSHTGRFERGEGKSAMLQANKTPVCLVQIRF